MWQRTSLGIITYDNQCRSKEGVSKNWDTALHKWVNVQRNTFKYDRSGNLIEGRNQYWDNIQKQWINKLLDTYSYSSDGLSSGYSVAYWDSTNKSWSYFAKYTDSFNTYGNKVSSLLEWYTNNIWQPRSRSFNEYNQDNLITYSESDNWQNNAWINSNKTEYQYSSDGLHKNSLYSIWDPGTQKWLKINRRQFDLVPETTLTKKVVTKGYSANTNTWTNYVRLQNMYDDNLALKFGEVDYWNANQNKWENSSRTRQDYYADGSIHHIYYDLWDITANLWAKSERTTYTHHSCNLQVGIARAEKGEEFNPADKSLLNTKQLDRNFGTVNRNGHNLSYNVPLSKGNKLQYGIINYYVTITANAMSNPATINKAPLVKEPLATGNYVFSVSPNPAKSYFIITARTQLYAENAILKMYDLSGKLIMTKKLQRVGAQKIELPAIAKGMYMVTITSNEGVQSMKLIVE